MNTHLCPPSAFHQRADHNKRSHSQVEVRGQASSNLVRLGSVLSDAEGRTVGAVRGHGVSIQLGRSTRLLDALLHLRTATPSMRTRWDGNVLEYVGFRAIPIGWMGAVELLQDVARRLVFRTTRVPAGSEFLPRGPLPFAEPISVTCLDDCNFIQKVHKGRHVR